MKNLKDFITESSIIAEGKSQIEVTDSGNDGMYDPNHKGQNVQISDDAEWMEINLNDGFITFYNKDDIKAIANEEGDETFEKRVFSMKLNSSFEAPGGNAFVRVRKI